MFDVSARYYDNGGESFDRFTVVYRSPQGGVWSYRGCSADPFGPQGLAQWGENLGCPVDHLSGVPRIGGRNHLGVRIAFADLPESVQDLVAQDLRVTQAG